MTGATATEWCEALPTSSVTTAAALQAEADKAALLIKLGITADEAKLLLN